MTREGTDFAVLSLRDAWDMKEYSDVSMYMNESNTDIHLQAIDITAGIFSAVSADEDAQFHVLFPGYGSSIPVGKTGARHPIDGSRFHCLYAKMVVNSGEELDEVRLWWFEDNLLTGSTYGSGRMSTFPFNGGWQLYAVDLNGFGDVGSDWSTLTAWQGLRIDPTRFAGVDFSVDWIRLTDCAEVPVTVSWVGAVSEVEVWVGVGNPNPDFMVPAGPLTLKNCTTTSCVLDVQGWEPGTYYVGVKESGSGSIVWASQPLIVDPAPIAHFRNPSFTSGERLLWEMEGIQDVEEITCAAYSFSNSILSLTTQPPGTIGSGCTSGGFSDPQIDLILPFSPVDTSTYRYLTFRIHMEGDWQDVNRGWIARWIWKNSDGCFQVSEDMPFDVGWQTLIVDLHDPVEGYPEDSAPLGCPRRHWSSSSTILLRLDPNENDTSDPFVQMIDWISLSKDNYHPAGTAFPIEFSTSESINDLTVDLFYTSDLSDPFQNLVIPVGNPSPPPSQVKIYLPMISNTSGGSGTDPIINWDTSGIAPGSYYICGQFYDGLNTTVYCSGVPVLLH